ncbi:MAG: ABC transporter ATP-binding protein, partial [Coprococcus sp.]
DVKGVVEYNNVAFKYSDGDEYVLKDISFVAEPGKTTAIIGSTGCGKSSLVQLIPRFYDVTDGNITIDGKDIRSLTMDSIRRNIGYVPQKGVLFSGTIKSNIKFGANDASDEQVKLSAEIAHASEFIEDKEKKYDSHISQGGTNVSGGQKQRLAIARAIARNPKIYIFDDSFSALDFKTDSDVRKALGEHTKDSTVFIVAQRVSTILHADQILVIDEGTLAGKGTHKELMKSCEAYRQIVESQLSEAEIADSLKEEV